MNTSRRTEIEQLLAIHWRTKQYLEVQKAQHNTINILHSLEEVNEQIDKLQRELGLLLPDHVFPIDLWTRESGNPHTPGAQKLDLSAFFTPEPPSSDVWEHELQSQLQALLKRCNQQTIHNLAVRAKAHISAALLLGFTFSTRSCYHVWVEQKPGEWWNSQLDLSVLSSLSKDNPLHIQEIAVNTAQPSTTPVHQELNGQLVSQELLTALRQTLSSDFNEGELQDLCFDLSIEYENLPGYGKSNKAREIVAYMRRRDGIERLITVCRQHRPQFSWPTLPQLVPNVSQLMPSRQGEDISVEISIARDIYDDISDTISHLQLPIGHRIQLSLPPSVTTVTDGWHAKQIAEKVSEVIRQARTRSRKRPIHLFAAVPVGLAVLIGAHLNASTPIQCYEHRKQYNDYVPACLLQGQG